MSNLPSVHRGTDSAERGYQRIRLRQDTEANWLKNDPILESGEFGYVIAAAVPGQMLKIGDGTRRWSELPFLAAQGNSGSPGPAGADGHSITVYGPSDSPPSPLNTQLYDGDMWLSNGLWAKNPNFDPALITPGAKGDKGDSGEIVGVSAVALPTGHAPTVNNTGTTTDANLVFGIPAGALGPRGIQGPIGTVGPKGPAGDTFKVSGAVANATALPATPANLAVFITQDDSHLHIYDPASAAAGANGYVDLGAIAGPQGQSTFYSNPVATAADLPATGAAGQCILALDTGHMHSWNPATAAWVDAGQIRGPSGAGISDGNADGQIPVWSVTFDAWQPTDVKIPKTIADLADVDDVIGNLGKDCVMVWDETAQVWTDSRSIEIDDIEFDASGPGTVLEGIAAYSDAGLDPTKDTWVPSCMAVDKYLRERINLEDLLDCNQLKFATNGQVPVWDDTNKRWTPTQKILPDGTADKQTLIWDSTAFVWSPAQPELKKLDDVMIPPDMTTADGWGIEYSDALKKFRLAPKVEKRDLDKVELESLHSVMHNGMIRDTLPEPPLGPALAGTVFLVSPNPTGVWVGHANKLAIHDVHGNWVFGSSQPGNTHYHSKLKTFISWDGTAWVPTPKILPDGTDGQVPVWNGTTSQWEPQDPSTASPIIYLGTGAWNAANVTSGADNYGMATDTVPSPADYPPLPGDQYIDLATGVVTAFTGAPGTKTPTTRTTAAIAGGLQPGLDALIENLGGLSDVTLSGTSDKQILQYESATSQWRNVTPDFLNPTNAYTKVEIDSRFTALVGGIAHGVAVDSIAATPPAAPQAGHEYIVAPGATGAWAGHENKVAIWHNNAWQFVAPHTGDTHLVEDQQSQYTWNGTAWVKVSIAAAPAATGDLWIVGSIQTSWLNETQFRTALGLNSSEDHKWVLADGRNVAGSQFQAITGLANVPDLRGAYLRMAGQNSNNQPDWNGETLRGYQNWMTARSRTTMTGATNNTGNHNHEQGYRTTGAAYYEYGHRALNKNAWVSSNHSSGTLPSDLPYTNTNGNHTHTVSINGGGDKETRPNSFSVNYFIKIN